MPKLIDLTGKTFGRIFVKKRLNSRGELPKWEGHCECGNITICSSKDLSSGDKKSCGCLRKDLLRIPLEGKRFGKLTVLKIAEKKGKSSSEFWFCKCDCGGEHIVSSQHLTLGFVNHCKSCNLKTDNELFEEAKLRFNKNIKKLKNGCWIWNGTRLRDYGVIYFKKTIKAHRFSYLIHKGELEEGKIICHTCDNKLCVNPEHLYQGTHKDNSRDALERNRMCIGEENYNSKLTEEDVKYILRSNEQGIFLAKKFNVNENTISRIRTRKQWKNVSP